MILFWLLAAVVSKPDACRYDAKALQALSQEAFDQNIGGGWRSLGDRGCYSEAAQVLRDYRIAHPSSPDILYWHEGQMRAFAGQRETAISLFTQSRKTGSDPWGWNIYVEGTIAFLNHDRAGLEAARLKLLALPRPTDFNSEIT